MNKNSNSLIIGAGLLVLLVVAGGVTWWFLAEEAEVPAEQKLPEEDVELYFYHVPEFRLNVVERTVPEARNESTRITQIIDELSNPPAGDTVVSLMPDGLELRSTYTRNQRVYLDFNDRIIGAAEGSSGEMMFLYSIVNSVLANLPDRYKLVQFLVEGEQRKTIGPYGEESGQIAVRYPLGPRWNLAE